MLMSVEVDLVFQSWHLIERQKTMDVGETESLFQVQLEIVVVDNVVRFVG